MRHSDGKDGVDKFDVPNEIGQKIDINKYFRDIHSLSKADFQELYIERNTRVLPDKRADGNDELASYLFQLSVDNWRDLKGSLATKKIADDFMSKALSKEPTIVSIVGPKGSGKTTFIHHFFEIYLPGICSATDVQLTPIIFDMRKLPLGELSHGSGVVLCQIYEYLDGAINLSSSSLGDQSDSDIFYTKIYPFDLSVLSDVMNKNALATTPLPYLSEGYRQQIQVMSKYKEDNFYTYLARKVSRLRTIESNVHYVFVLDNIDHHVPDYGEQAVAIIQGLHEGLSLDAIVTLRDTTIINFHNHAASKAWVESRRVGLQALDVGDLGTKRIRFLFDKFASQLEGGKRAFFDDIMYQVKRGRRGGPDSSYNFAIAWDWLEKLSNSDYRTVLSTLSRALVSNHLFDNKFDKEKFVLEWRHDRRYGLNVKRLKTAFINGYRAYYSESQSNTNVINLFDAGDSAYIYNYIIRIKILQYVHKEGRFQIDRLKVYLESIIKLKNQPGRNFVDETLDIFIRRGLISIFRSGGGTDAPYPVDVPSGDMNINCVDDFRGLEGVISDNGRFHLNVLMYDDIYLDEMKNATNLPEEIYNNIFSGNSYNRAAHRKITTERFIKFIKNQEETSGLNLSRNLGVTQILNESHKQYIAQKAKEDFFTAPV